MTLKKLLLLSLFLVAVHKSHAQYILSDAQLEALKKISLQDIPDANAPGIAGTVIIEGQVAFESYSGMADIDNRTPITKETKFNIASNAKQFTALAILLLEHEKKLELTDDIRSYLPNIFKKIKDKITISSLLNHTSGIRDVYDILSLQGITWWEKNYNNADILSIIEKQEDLNFKPGTDYLYSNTNYILLASVIEKASGKPFTEYTNIMFRKLGMNQTSFRDEKHPPLQPFAKAYFNFNEWTTYDWIWNACGDGNLFTTLPDLVLWEQIIMGSRKCDIDKSVISKSQLLVNDSNPEYGYGLETGTYGNFKCLHHEGATGAWKASLLRFPDKKISVITLTNSGKVVPYTQNRQLADVVLNRKSETKDFAVAPVKIGDFIDTDEIKGTYEKQNDNFYFQFIIENEKLLLRRTGRNDVELERECANVFHQKYDPEFKQEFIRNTDGIITVTAYYTTHPPYTLTKVKPLSEQMNPDKLNGTYRNKETGTVLQLKYSDELNFSITNGNNTSKGLLISDNKMIYDFYTLLFDEKGLILNGDRIKNVRFIKTSD